MRVTDFNEQWLQEAVLIGWREANVDIPQLLLKYYRELKLSDQAAMLLIHLVCFTDKERKPFPTIDEIQQRMSCQPDVLVDLLQQLLNQDWIRIDEHIDPDTGIHDERFNLQPMMEKLALHAARRLSDSLRERLREEKGKNKGKGSDIFSVFEQEFARPLTPMELETISSWLDRDQYPEELVRMALKEAVFSGKVSFRYIDRILLEWGRNRVQTVEQAREYSRQFRSRVENGSS